MHSRFQLWRPKTVVRQLDVFIEWRTRENWPQAVGAHRGLLLHDWSLFLQSRAHETRPVLCQQAEPTTAFNILVKGLEGGPIWPSISPPSPGEYDDAPNFGCPPFCDRRRQLCCFHLSPWKKSPSTPSILSSSYFRTCTRIHLAWFHSVLIGIWFIIAHLHSFFKSFNTHMHPHFKLMLFCRIRHKMRFECVEVVDSIGFSTLSHRSN